MRLATVEQSREIDARSQKVYNLCPDILMESAGGLAAREINQSFLPEISRGLTSIVCGPGHNGGDGLVVARHMHSMGHRDLMVFISTGGNQTELLKIQLDRVKRQGIKVVPFTEKLDLLESSTLIIDALFGIGYSRGLNSESQQVVDLINSSKAVVVSLDAPSGLDCDRGIVDGTAVRATMTVSFGLAKPGFFVADGPTRVGRLRVLPIGFPFEVLTEVATTHSAFDERQAQHHLPHRKNRSHKSDHGRLLVCAGSEGHWGAGVLAASSAYRMGAGYVIWASDTLPSKQIIDIPEVMTATIDEALSSDKRADAITLGCGLGVHEKTAHWIRRLKEEDYGKVVLDADGITAAVEFNLMPFPESWVMTPHAGELSRMIDQDVCDIEKDRFKAVLGATERAGCHVLLKGYRSVLSHGMDCTIINSGNSALAKAGTGDVLTGMIGALLAQGLETLPATATAAYLHGRMADEWVRAGQHKISLNASDLRECLPSLLGRLVGE